MVTIHVDNSYSQITGLDPKQFAALRKELSYSTGSQALYAGGNYPRVRYLIDNKGFFPTGLLSRLERHLEKTKIPSIYHPNSMYITTEKVNHKADWTSIHPYRHQLEAVNMADICHRGSLEMPTGSGKSLVLALITDKFSVRTLIIV